MFRGGEIGYMDIFKVIEKTMEAHKKDLNMQPSLDEIVSVASICVCVCVCITFIYRHIYIDIQYVYLINRCTCVIYKTIYIYS